MQARRIKGPHRHQVVISHDFTQKKAHRIFLPSTLILLLALGPSFLFGYISPLFSEESSDSQANLARRYDAVTVKGEKLEGLQGLSISSFRLYACRAGRFQPIPFQIDERDQEGEYVLPLGRLAGEDIDQGLLDYNDELVFMAHDAADRASEGPAGVEGVDQWVEIELLDPLASSQKAWVYLCHFPLTPPPGSDIDYVHYDPDQEQIFSDHYLLGYRKGMSLYTDLHYPDGKGGYGPDLMDRLKIRIQVKFLFNVFKINKSEEDMRADVVAWKDGPVRVLRDVQNYVRIMFRLSSPSVFSVTAYYSKYMYTPLRVTVPFDLKWVFNHFGVSDWHWLFYGDLPGLAGGMMYTNRNLQGFPIATDKPLDWYEKNVDTRYLVWGYATKEKVGTWFCNLLIPDATFQFTHCYLNLDKSGEYPPEDFGGEIGGGAMMNWKNVDPALWALIIPGTYVLGLETFFAPPGLKPEGVQEWRNIREFPVQTMLRRQYPAPSEISGKTATKQEWLEPEKARKGLKIMALDIHGKQIPLYDPKLHFGHMKATGLDVAIGQDLTSRKWHSIPLEDISTIDHHIGTKDPITGMERPLMARITTKTGKVLNLISCKCCTLSGYRPDGKQVSYLLTELKGWKTAAP